tara:strand:+ start:222 stop:1190 length:969 start_codon:yes stop_codon:yes gene_type:complete
MKQLKINIYPGRDPHFLRLTQGLRMLGHDVSVNAAGRFDMAFVSPSYVCTKKDIDADMILFFDCEDDHKHFDPDVAYHELKDKVLAYAKMNYVEDDRGDGIKNIAFPIAPYLALNDVAKADFGVLQYYNAIPFLVGAPTFIGNYKGPYTEPQTSDGVHFVAPHPEGNLLFNQRYQWLLSLRNNNIPHQGGIVFKDDNMSLKWQKEWFGDVEKFKCPPLSNKDHLTWLANCKIGLCPTGHDRMSWRVFDIMATGAILVWTDTEQKTLYSPKSSLRISDDADIGSILLDLQPAYKDIWLSHQDNKKMLAELTPEKIWDDFIGQL